MSDQNSRDRAGTDKKPRHFLRDENGAVTVDWVVLTASIALLGAAVGFTVSSNVPGLADEIAEVMSETELGVN
ncbi:MAG TPA: hypothetical protein DIU07_04755 [Rhodobacteraceae bacterium]|nr:hypothetical protein [Paracoccaceae bacterium]